MRPVQMVLISARPPALGQTLRHVARFMPWISEAVVACPGRLMDEMEREARAVPVRLLSDEAVTGSSPEELAAMEHAPRNMVLLEGLIGSDVVAPTFVMSDDDYRPMIPIDASFFGDDDRHRLYFSYDLERWVSEGTSFDDAQLATRDALVSLGLPLRSYAAHMPQVIDRDLWRASAAVAGDVTTAAVCQWSFYGNWAPAQDPGRFLDPQPYETLCWPQWPGQWRRDVVPPRYSFENHHPEMYGDTSLFTGLPTEPVDEPESLRDTKVSRWHDAERHIERLEFHRVPGNPWTTSTLRRIYHGGRRLLRRLTRR